MCLELVNQHKTKSLNFFVFFFFCFFGLMVLSLCIFICLNWFYLLIYFSFYLFIYFERQRRIWEDLKDGEEYAQNMLYEKLKNIKCINV